jgi:hypothetical protein
MHCQVYVPAAPVWNVNVVLAFGAMGTLRPSLAMVNVWATPVVGSSLSAVRVDASLLGSAGSIGWTVSCPRMPSAMAYCRLAAGSAVASSKLMTVIAS